MDPDPQSVVESIDSEDAREILALASREPMSVDEFEAEVGVSLATVYRRTDELTGQGFLEERTEVADDGDHYSSYETSLHRITFTVEDGEFRVDVEVRRDDDKFARLWRSLGGSS
ncbi:ArsR/SmtB family transcription factor [Halobium salinum]|uniref:ArsR/SmtB family transcription factor n=1 Tax=Halobium salinum TaxID=1364940 RepID=A0ABD5PC22_9EURY|nr:helix-turn-helix domain-containing protein [Halobium salinum]